MKKGIYMKIAILLIVIAILMLIVWCINKKYNQEKEVEEQKENATYVELGRRTKQNISQKIKQEKEFDGIIMQSADITYSNKISTFAVTIANKNDKEYQEKNIEIVFLDENNQTIDTIKTKIPTISARGVVTLNATTQNDISQAYDYFINEIVDVD